MRKWFPELPEGGWIEVAILTTATTIAVSILAVLGMLVGNSIAGEPVSAPDYYTTIALTGLITPPVFAFLKIKLLQLGEVNAELHRFATIDAMTGALNRRAFFERVEARLASPEAAPRGAALFVIDVDHFKQVNDRFGHQTGDSALTRIAAIIRANLRDGDLFGRLGGEEFGAFLEHIHPAAALDIAERCRLAVGQCCFAPDETLHALSVSIGIAFPDRRTDLTALYKLADDRLYAAKAQGRNRIEPRPVPEAA